METDWPYKRHAEIFAGALRYGAENDRWDCFVDEHVGDHFESSRRGEFPYDGVVGRIDGRLAKQLVRRRIPVVNVWTNSPAANIPRVGSDHAAGGRLRADHLLQRGFQRFACLGVSSDRAYQTESAAFVAEIRASGYECHKLDVEMPMLGDTPAKRRQALGRINDWMACWQLPIGVFVGPDAVGRRITQMCRLQRWRVPEDVAIIAGYNQEEICERPSPGLTSLEIDNNQIGYAAAQLLDRLIDGERPPQRPILIPPIGIVARTSTDFTAVEDEMLQIALRFISSKLHEQIQVDDVAKAALTSRATIERRFRQHLGRSVAAEIRRLRIEKAKRCLTRSERPIFQIARDCGFLTASQFSRVFSQEVGQTASQFRLA